MEFSNWFIYKRYIVELYLISKILSKLVVRTVWGNADMEQALTSSLINASWFWVIISFSNKKLLFTFFSLFKKFNSFKVHGQTGRKIPTNPSRLAVSKSNVPWTVPYENFRCVIIKHRWDNKKYYTS